jgi:hypothetical protein
MSTKMSSATFSDNCEFIIQYYQGDKREKIENRRKLGERLGVAINTFRMRHSGFGNVCRVALRNALTLAKK